MLQDKKIKPSHTRRTRFFLFVIPTFLFVIPAPAVMTKVFLADDVLKY